MGLVNCLLVDVNEYNRAQHLSKIFQLKEALQSMLIIFVFSMGLVPFNAFMTHNASSLRTTKPFFVFKSLTNGIENIR